MPVVVLQPSGRTTLHASQQGPESHVCLSVLALFLNPPLGLVALCFAVSSRMSANMDWENARRKGLVALCFAISSRMSANMDWDGARRKGKIAMFFSILGISLTLTATLIFVLVFFTKDSNET